MKEPFDAERAWKYVALTIMAVVLAGVWWKAEIRLVANKDDFRKPAGQFFGYFAEDYAPDGKAPK